VVPEVTLGKRCARLDLRTAGGRARFESLLRGADVLVHGYRSDALARLGLHALRRDDLRPGLVDVSLDAYGWTGPWRTRRGFDSLVQMSSGIAEAGMRWRGADRPVPLPVQALDHATGYLMAAAVVRGLVARDGCGEGVRATCSLARTARLLVDAGAMPPAPRLVLEAPEDRDADVERTPWGPARRLRPPVFLEGAAMWWRSPACQLGSSSAAWT
jgi:crotonobetainyl-CoA:carnitine CoA-transferase CaiB-like acyl-CoA transferase